MCITVSALFIVVLQLRKIMTILKDGDVNDTTSNCAYLTVVHVCLHFICLYDLLLYFLNKKYRPFKPTGARRPACQKLTALLM